MKIKFKKCILLLLNSVLIIRLSAQVGDKGAIMITNEAAINFQAHVISIPWEDVLSAYPSIDTARFKVINASTQKEIPFQLEYRGEATIQNLLVQADIAAHRSLKIYLQPGKPSAVAPKTYCRYVPERKDDFAWENDRIAFRMYGKALEQYPDEMAYGMDVWVKRTGRLILNERYKRGEYHIDHGDGLDYYHVGFSLGAGNIAPYVNDTIYYSKNYREWKVLDNGPLRSSFQLFYDEWDAGGRMVKAIKTISMDAGSQMSRVEVNYRYSSHDSLPVVVGIVKRKEPGTMLLDEKIGIMGYWEPQHGKDGITGTGTVFFKPVVKMQITDKHLLSQLIAGKIDPVIYYTGAVWDKAGIITDAEAWFSYLHLFQQQLLQPLKVKHL